MADAKPLRVVSLLPSATEIVCALGGRGELVGVSHECDHPPEVAGLPALTSSRLGDGGSSGQIDRSVRELLRAALAIYDLDVDRLAGLDPDVVVTQDLCEVCAVPYGAVCAALDRLAGREVQVVSLHPRRLGDIWDDVRRVAAAIGREAAGEALVRGLLERLGRVERRVAGAGRPGVVSVEWLDPVMLGGTWMPELIAVAGGLPLGVAAGERAPTLDLAALGALAPEVVVVKPCGYPVERTLAELELLAKVLPWDAWPAVRAGRVYVADGNAYFNRSGPRIVDSAELLAACLHPDRFPDRLGLDLQAVRRVDAELAVHPALLDTCPYGG
jgi:iron complex transport system substrate-binding protein